MKRRGAQTRMVAALYEDVDLDKLANKPEGHECSPDCEHWKEDKEDGGSE
jgi:hypothetical protein